MIRVVALLALVALEPGHAGELGRPSREWGLALAPGGRSGCCYGLETDATGHSYFAGSFEGALSIPGREIESAGLHDVFLAKFDTAGQCLWATRAGSPSEDHAAAAAVAADGSCYVVGQVDGTARFGEKILLYFMETKSFLARYASSGECLWVVTARGKIEESVKAVAVARNGDAIVAGTHVPKNSPDDTPTVYLARYAQSNGEKLWVRSIEGAGRSLAVAIDSSGAIYVAGAAADGPFARRGGPRHPLEKAPLLLCFDASGEPKWTWAPTPADPTSRSGRLTTVDALPGGGCLVAGEVLGEVAFGERTPKALGGVDGFVARVDAGGECRWVRRIGGPADDHVLDLAATASGGSALSAIVRGSARFGPRRVSAEPQALVIAALDSKGRFTWIEAGAGPGRDEQEAIGYEVAADPEGGVLVGGWFRERLEIGEVRVDGGYDTQFLIRLLR